MDETQLQQTGEGIQRLYLAGSAGEQQHLSEREEVVQRARDLRAQLRVASDPETVSLLRRKCNQTIVLLSEIDCKLAATRAQMQELENDYRFYQCDVSFGVIDWLSLEGG